MYAVVAQRLAKPQEETVEASLGRAVDEVGAPYPLTRDAGQRHDPAVCLGLHALAQQHAKVDRCGVVDLSQLERKLGVVPCPFRIAEQTEGDHGDIDVTATEGLLDGRRVRFMIASIKINFGDLATKSS